MRFALNDEEVAKAKKRMAGMEFVFYDAEMLWVLFRTDP